MTPTFSPGTSSVRSVLPSRPSLWAIRCGGGGEDVGGRAVVALEPDDLGAGEVVLEAQDVVDLGAAPAVDRLVVVADAADVLRARAAGFWRRAVWRGQPEGWRGLRGGGVSARSAWSLALAPRGGKVADGAGARALPQQPQPQILGDVGVLVLVDQDVLEALLVLPQHVRLLAEQADVLDQQIAEIGGVEHLQPLLIGDVELLALAAGEARALAGRHLVGRQAAVLPAVDQAGEHARRPALLVDVLGLEQLLDQPDLVVDVEDGEIGLQPDQLGVPAQDLAADRVEGAEPGHALDHAADHGADALLHLARGLVGEGDGEDLRRPGPPGGEDVGDARGQHPGLAGPRAGQHQHRPVERHHRLALLRIEVLEIGRRPPADPRARADPAGRGRRRFRSGVKLQGVGQAGGDLS